MYLFCFSLVATSATVPNNYPIHSLHAYFILAGDSDKELLFEIERTRDGGSFKTRSCKVKQDGKTICLAQMSFHKIENGVENQLKLEDLIAPFKVPNINELDFDAPGMSNLSGFGNIRRHMIMENDMWEVVVTKALDELKPTLEDDNPENRRLYRGWRSQCGMLAFMSDQGIVTQIRNTHPDVQWLYGKNVSLDHSIHFHRPKEIDVFDWMYFFTETKATGFGRGLGTTHVFNTKGVLVATVTQEALIRAQM